MRLSEEKRIKLSEKDKGKLIEVLKQLEGIKRTLHELLRSLGIKSVNFY